MIAGAVNCCSSALIDLPFAVSPVIPLEIAASEHAAAQDAPAVAYVRPHDIEIERHKNGQPAIAATIQHIRPVGPVVRLKLKRQDTGQMIEAELSKERFRELELKTGEVVFIKPKHWTVYQGEGI